MRRIDSRTRRLVRSLKDEAMRPPRRHSAALEGALDEVEALACLGPEGLARHLAAVASTARRRSDMSILPEIPPDGLLDAMAVAGAHEVSPCHDLIGPMEAAYHAMRDWLSANAVAGQVDDMLSCPFCGGNAINSQAAGTATVECRDCHAIITIIGDTKAVIAEWNLRAPLPPPAARSDALEAERDVSKACIDLLKEPHEAPTMAAGYELLADFTEHAGMGTPVALAAPPAPSAWRPIETAPKTSDDFTGGTVEILGWLPDDTAPKGGNRETVWWEPKLGDGGKGAWWFCGDYEVHPTHWMPLPAPPAPKERED